jgi:hypothetical protein
MLLTPYPASSTEQDTLDRVTSGDRDFFALHSDRQYRLRRMSKPEIKAERLSKGPAWTKAPIGFVPFVAVRRVTASSCIQAAGLLVSQAAEDPAEGICRSLFWSWWPYTLSDFLNIEATLRERCGELS